MKHIPEPDVAWLRDPGASVNRLAVHSTWRSRRPLQMLSSTWQVTGVSGTAAELIERTPHQRDFEATSIPGILELDGLWVRREEEARRAAEAQGEPAADQVRASILRREFILDAPLKDASERGWTMTLTFGGFTGPLYVWLDGIFVGFCADGFIPAAFDVTDALEPMHTHEISVLLMDSPACCHGLFREVSLEARPPAHVIDVIPQASHDGTSGSLRLRVECSEASNTSSASGVSGRPSRSSAARTECAGSSRDSTRLPTTGESSGKMSACMDTAAVLNENRRTGIPTETASSTSAVMIRGVDTETSTPHA